MKRPPTIGAATRFIRSAPVPADHMIGIRPIEAAATVAKRGQGLRAMPPAPCGCCLPSFVLRRV